MTYWAHPLLLSEADLDEAWARETDDPVLLIVGSGFDPRAAVVLERLTRATSRRIDGLMLELPEGATDLDVRPRAHANRERIGELIIATGGELGWQGLPGYNDPKSLGRLISRAFQLGRHLESYREIVIDISALPRSIFFPLVRGVLERAHRDEGDNERWDGNLHVTVCENPEADEGILEEGTSPMAPIGGFSGARSQDPPATTIWVPVLGEGAYARVHRLHEELEYDEVCPVLPLPARDPRRGDRLVLEYRQLLFDEIEIEPRNLIYAAERNPFDLYRTLDRLYERYRQSLSPLGTVGMVLSSHSSKLLSVGVLLTAYEHDLEVQHVSPGSYGLTGDAEALRAHDEIFDLWLTGEPYQ